jgi:hypothetical protein
VAQVASSGTFFLQSCREFVRTTTQDSELLISDGVPPASLVIVRSQRHVVLTMLHIYMLVWSTLNGRLVAEGSRSVSEPIRTRLRQRFGYGHTNHEGM